MQLPRVIIAAVFAVLGALITIQAVFKSDGSASPSASSASASPSPSASSSSSPGTPKPTRSGTAKQPARPVTADIGAVSCPARTVHVKVRNAGTKTEDFSVERDDGGAAVPGQIAPGNTRTISVKLREDRRTDLAVTWANKRIETKAVRANCKKAGAAPSETPPGNLPHTGPDTVLWARAATGVGIILTGAIIFWYGGIWPRRRERIFAGKKDS
ncbi:hypothetical protein HUT06_35735 [Actinomadura sp. NAK00032]|uniref:hypothetical protein n=1 Tax=Actinomadura sp. NAK00032 TaxID=2742128 RepID=UPI0015925315|nr:hypothetical protein [Actinomadura sp. NAK00032]QKW38712.1 hypothetical protein HUT06_35735 [Actinomadura sp. NAK00032]